MASEINKSMRSYFDVLAHRDPTRQGSAFSCVSCGSSKDVRPLSVVAMFHLQTAQFQLCQPPVTFPFFAHCAMCGQGRLDRKWKAVGKESSGVVFEIEKCPLFVGTNEIVHGIFRKKSRQNLNSSSNFSRKIEIVPAIFPEKLK